MIRASVALLVALLAGSAVAQVPSNPWWTDFARHRQSVTIAPGRSLNLLCLGKGQPTVILEAGMGDGAASWRMIQRTLAETMRVCSYDRAGLGWSPPATGPRDAAAITSDLEALVKAAWLEPPFVLVGHSLGGQTIRLFAARNRAKVRGLVLVDPPGDFLMERLRSRLPAVMRRSDRELDPVRACAAEPRPAAVGETCRRRPWRDLPPDLAGTFVPNSAPSSYATLLAENDGFERSNSRQLARVDRRLGDRRLIVLVADEPELPAGLTLAEASATRSLLLASRRALARWSREGEARMVANSGHYIQFDQPQAVVEAVREAAR